MRLNTLFGKGNQRRIIGEHVAITARQLFEIWSGVGIAALQVS
jgi:hypothetical protein